MPWGNYACGAYLLHWGRLVGQPKRYKTEQNNEEPVIPPPKPPDPSLILRIFYTTFQQK